MFKKLFELLSKREKRFIFVLLLASIFISFLETFGLSFVMVFASIATNFDAIHQNRYYDYAYRFLGCNSSVNFVMIVGFALIGFYFIRGISITLFTYAMNRFSQGRFKHFAFKFFQNYLNFHYKNFTSINSSLISKVIFSDAGSLVQIVTSILTIAAESLTILFIYITLLFVHWKMTLVLTVLLTAKITFIIKTFSQKLVGAGKMTQYFNMELSKTFGESFGNFKIIKLLSNEKYILKRFDKAGEELVKANTFRAVLQSTPRVILETLGFALLISVILYVVYMYNDATHIIPVISMYAFAFYRFLPSANKILAEYNNINFCKHTLDSVQTYLTYDLEDLGNEKIYFNEKIELKNVSFSYDGKSKILDGANLIIYKGQRTAFVGESGAGKSTIVEIIMSLYRPQMGEIFIDNSKLDQKNLRDWRGRIGYIPQQIYLFDGTVAENIVFGREYDENKVIAVLKKANIYNFLLKHDGIHKKVGEGGVQLSGGQRQRIAIARALYSDPEILVLDEATSALDNETESKIMEEIYSLNVDKTLIIVAHRLTTVERCENIYKIENGKVVRVEDISELTKKPVEQQVQV